jgi:FHA domain-containing protein
VQRGDELQTLKLRLDKAGFERKHGHLWLVRELDVSEVPAQFETRAQHRTIPMKLARKASAGAVDLLTRIGHEPGRFGFYPIAKQPIEGGIAPAASAPDRITVGRATNNDIVLWHESVSKLHAFFVDDDDRGWVIEDAGSTNGSMADGVVLAPGEIKAIKSGSSIVFGSLPCAVIASGELFDCI